MTEAATWTLQVRVEGLSLWMHRGTHIDVLFPDDRLPPEHAEHHFVTMHDANAPLDEVDQRVDHATLDFTGLPFREHSARVVPASGTIPLEIEAGALATHADAVLTGKGLVAGLRLPLGTLVSLGDELKPFSFGHHTNLSLTYGMAWEGELKGQQSLTVSRIMHGSGAKSDVQLPGGAAQMDRTVKIRCLSARDRTGQDEIKPGDELHEVKFFGHITTKGKAPLPRGPRYDATAFLESTPKKPCPSAYGTPFG